MNIHRSRYFPLELKDAWERVPPDCRFSYEINRPLVIYLLVMLAVIWTYYVYTAISVPNWSLSLTLYPVVYAAFTGWMVVKLLRWRAFTLRAGVVVGPKELLWSADGVNVYRAAWSDLSLEKLGLMEASTAKSWDVNLTITTPDGKRHTLYLTKIYAKITRMESLLQHLLVRAKK